MNDHLIVNSSFLQIYHSPLLSANSSIVLQVHPIMMILNKIIRMKFYFVVEIKTFPNNFIIILPVYLYYSISVKLQIVKKN